MENDTPKESNQHQCETRQQLSELREQIDKLGQALNEQTLEASKQQQNQEAHLLLLAGVIDDIVADLAAAGVKFNQALVSEVGGKHFVDWERYYKLAEPPPDPKPEPDPLYPQGTIVFGGNYNPAVN